MTDRQGRLRELANQAVRDIVELDAQVAGGELSDDAARPLRERYETLAGRALEALDSATDEVPAPKTGPRRPRTWALAYTLAGVGALVAALVLLPAAVVDRPAGGFVTGNETLQQENDAPPLDPTATVTDEQLEQVVAANPEVVGMRLALADRYVAQGAYDRAMRHYLDALRREPRNAEALARLGWLLLQINQPQEALESVQQALAIDPTLDGALWFKANIELYGLDDPAAALASLQELAGRDLTPDVRDQVNRLTADAERREEGTG